MERIVDEIDGIVRIVRFPGWQDTETGRREVSMELYGIFARKKLFDKDLVEKPISMLSSIINQVSFLSLKRSV